MITVGICTYNRSHLWKNRKLLRSLQTQTDKDFEVLVCDDGSTDDTVMYLSDSFEDFKLFRTKDTKEPNQASGVADNVLIGEASGDVFLHLDDDGWVDLGLIKRIKSYRINEFHATWWGEIVNMSNVCTAEELDEQLNVVQRLMEYKDFGDGDKRLVILKEVNRMLQEEGRDKTVSMPLEREWNMSWGAMWACPTSELKLMGGHEHETMKRRGQDSRLGNRLASRMYQFFTREMKFYHYGLSELQKLEVRQDDDAAENMIYLSDKIEPPIMNGGIEYWKSDRFKNLYERII